MERNYLAKQKIWMRRRFDAHEHDNAENCLRSTVDRKLKEELWPLSGRKEDEAERVSG